MNAKHEKALAFVQIAKFELTKQYLGDLAGDEIAVLDTLVPERFADLMGALHAAEEALLDAPCQWGEQAVQATPDGFIRLKQLGIFAPAKDTE